MKYSVKIIIRHTIETGEVFLEESILMLDADSFDDAYKKAERYVKENELCKEYENIYGNRVHSEVISYADCFSVYDDEDVVEVYSTIRRVREAMSENNIISVLEDSCTRKDMLPLRQWIDPNEADETDYDQM